MPEAPSPSSIARAWTGFTRPFTLLAALRTDAPSWRRFWITSSAQALATLAMAVSLVWLKGGLSPEDGGLGFQQVLNRLAVLNGSLVSAQWVTLALSREFQNPVARALCLVAGIAPEDEDEKPRLRLDTKWLFKKLKQRVRGLLVLLPGFMAFVPIYLVTVTLGVDEFVMPALMFGWSFYWWCAFTAGRSARAWRDEEAGTFPGPVRWWLARTQSTFGFRWFLPRWVGRFAVYATHRDAAPAVAMERDLPTFVGLGLARMLLSFPLVRLFFRSAIDTAAADALEHLPPAKASATGELQQG